MEDLHGALVRDVLALRPVVQGVRLVQEPGTCQDRSGCVNPARPTGWNHQQGADHHGPCIEDHLDGNHLGAGNGAEHGNVGVAVVLAVAHGQGPVVRRRPKENDHEQDDGRPLDGVGHGGPGNQHREAARRSAPHNVLGGTALKDDGVDDHVEENRPDPEPRGQRVGSEPEDDNGGHPEQPGENQRLTRRHLARDEWTVLGPVHQFVDVAVKVAVEGTGTAGREGTAYQGGQDQPDRRKTALGVNHGGQGADQQQLNDARLGEGEIRLGLAGQPGSPFGAGSIKRRICCAHGGSHPFWLAVLWRCGGVMWPFAGQPANAHQKKVPATPRLCRCPQRARLPGVGLQISYRAHF